MTRRYCNLTVKNKLFIDEVKIGSRNLTKLAELKSSYR